VEECVFERIHDDISGERHRIGVLVGEPTRHRETYFMTDPLKLVIFENDVSDVLQIEGTDGLYLVVKLFSK